MRIYFEEKKIEIPKALNAVDVLRASCTSILSMKIRSKSSAEAGGIYVRKFGSTHNSGFVFPFE